LGTEVLINLDAETLKSLRQAGAVDAL